MAEIEIPNTLFLESTMTTDDYGLAKQELHAISRIAMAGHGAHAEALRYHYLRGIDSQSITEAISNRMASESGSGRTRAETNAPAATSAKP